MRFSGWVSGIFYIRKRRPFPYGIRRRFLLTSGRMLLEVSIFRPQEFPEARLQIWKRGRSFEDV